MCACVHKHVRTHTQGQKYKNYKKKIRKQRKWLPTRFLNNLKYLRSRYVGLPFFFSSCRVTKGVGFLSVRVQLLLLKYLRLITLVIFILFCLFIVVYLGVRDGGGEVCALCDG